MPPRAYSLSNSIGILVKSISFMTHFLYVPRHPKSFHLIYLPAQTAVRSIMLPILFHVLSI